MQLVIDSQGVVHTLYDEAFDLQSLGPAVITRASHVEPDADGQWWAELIGGPRLGPFGRRSAALAAEVEWLETHGMRPGGSSLSRLAVVLLTTLVCLTGCSRSAVTPAEPAESSPALVTPAPQKVKPGVSGNFRGLTTDYFSSGGAPAPPSP